MNRRQLIDTFITSVACFLVLIGLLTKIRIFMDGQWLNAGGAIIFYLLQLGLFIFRRPSRDTVNVPTHYLFALCGTCLPLLMQSNPDAPEPFVWAALPIEAIGMVVTVIALAGLGRGFGIFAANREIKTQGLYQFIRHPLYTGEAIWFFGLVLHNFSWFNLALFAVQTGCQIKRMRDEEALLLKDSVYETYFSQVRYRMLPGIF